MKHAEEKISVSGKLYIEQIEKDTAYKGTFVIAGTKLEYEIRFSTSTSSISQIPDDKDEFRRLIQITVKQEDKDGGDELTDEEYMLFFGLIVKKVVEFQNNLFTHLENKISEALIEANAESPPICTTIEGTLNFNSAAWEVLSSPKFGCSL